MAKRNPRPAAWAVLIGVLLAVVLGVRACAAGDPYARDALELAAASAELGGQVTSLPERLDELDRRGLFVALRGWQERAEEHLARAGEIRPPAAYSTVHGYLVAALGLRAEALRRYPPAVDNALAAGDVQVAVGQIVAIQRDLAAADRTYALFREGWPRPGEETPPSAWVSGDGVVDTESVRSFVGSLRDRPQLYAVYDLKVIDLEVSPKPVAQEGGRDVLPLVRAVQVTVVVENTGNEPLPRVPVVALLTSERNPRPQRVDASVGPLRPGQRRSVTLNGITPEAGGPANLLRVTAGPVAGEASLENNTLEYTFAMRSR